MATIAIVLNTTKKYSDNTYPVSLRVTNNRVSKYFYISSLVVNQTFDWRCKSADWKNATKEDNGFGKFKKSFKEYLKANKVLEKILENASLLLDSFDHERIDFSFGHFESRLKNTKKLEINSLQDYYKLQIAILDEQKRIGLAGLYYETQRILYKFKPKALLSDVNIRFLESFEYWLRNERRNKDTTISVKMRNLQRVINQAIEDGLFKKENYPFGEKKFSINKRLDCTTKKIAITIDTVSKLKALNLVPGSALHLAQQLFLFSYYCRGMNFIDLTFLSWNDVSHTHISYIRRKTRGKFEIRLNEYSKNILKYFGESNPNKSGFVFPIIDITVHITLQQQYTRKKTALKVVNDNLKKLALLINEPNLKLTTNVARHTYATALKRSGAKTSYITEALGHATEFQTQTYLDQFESGLIEELEIKIFNI